MAVWRSPMFVVLPKVSPLLHNVCNSSPMFVLVPQCLPNVCSCSQSFPKVSPAAPQCYPVPSCLSTLVNPCQCVPQCCQCYSCLPVLLPMLLMFASFNFVPQFSPMCSVTLRKYTLLPTVVHPFPFSLMAEHSREKCGQQFLTTFPDKSCILYKSYINLV